MSIFNSISSISNPSTSMKSNLVATSSSTSDIGNSGDSIAFFGGDGFGGGFGGGFCGGFGGGCCGGRNVNIINIDIDVGRRRRRCC